MNLYTQYRIRNNINDLKQINYLKNNLLTSPGDGSILCLALGDVEC